MHEKPLAKMQEEKSALLHHLQEEKLKTITKSSMPSQAGSTEASEVTRASSTDSNQMPTHSNPSIVDAETAEPLSSTTVSSAHKPNGTGIGTSRFVSKLEEDNSDSDGERNGTDSEDSDVDEAEVPSKQTHSQQDSLRPNKAAPDHTYTAPTDAILISQDQFSSHGNGQDRVEAAGSAKGAETMSALPQLDHDEEAVLKDDDLELHRIHKVRRSYPIRHGSGNLLARYI